MFEAFDRYRKWLGIPAAEQPPHHYRGLPYFCADARVSPPSRPPSAQGGWGQGITDK